MGSKDHSPFRSIFPAALILALVGWGGLYELIVSTRPTVWPRWLFFFLVVMAFSGTALPFVALLNRRFPSYPPASLAILVRQALWFGIYAALLAWLQMGRILTPSMAIFLGLGFIVVEGLLRLRENSRWKP